MIDIQKDGELLIIRTGTTISGKVLMWTSLYYYNGVVIDCGCPNTSEEVYRYLKSIGEIKAVLLTHHHEDHIGAASLFINNGYPVYAPKGAIDYLRDPPDIPEYRKLIWGQPESFNAEPIEESSFYIDDIKISVFKTPGHSPDHVVYLIDDLIFIGDLIGSVKPKIAYRHENYNQIIKSVKYTLCSVNFTKAYGGHLIISKKDIKTFLKYLEDLKKRIQYFLSQGLSIDNILEVLLKNVPEKVYMMERVSQGEWHRKYLVESLMYKQ